MKSAAEATAGVHAVAVLTEWDEFKALDWRAMYSSMQQPAFVFDGRNLLDHAALRDIGFVVYALGASSRARVLSVSAVSSAVAGVFAWGLRGGRRACAGDSNLRRHS